MSQRKLSADEVEEFLNTNPEPIAPMPEPITPEVPFQPPMPDNYGNADSSSTMPIGPQQTHATPAAPPVSMMEMTRDQETFEKYRKLGAFDFDTSATGIAIMGMSAVDMLVTDSWEWASSIPERVASNFTSTDFSGMKREGETDHRGVKHFSKEQKAEAKKRAKLKEAEAQATVA